MENLERIDAESLIRRVREKIIAGIVKRERSKKTWEETVVNDMKRMKLTLEGAQDRVKLRRRCRQLVNLDELGE